MIIFSDFFAAAIGQTGKTAEMRSVTDDVNGLFRAIVIFYHSYLTAALSLGQGNGDGKWECLQKMEEYKFLFQIKKRVPRWRETRLVWHFGSEIVCDVIYRIAEEFDAVAFFGEFSRDRFDLCPIRSVVG